MYRALRTVIDSLDQRRVQVYVEALIVEISTGLAAEFGVQWQGARNIGDGQTLYLPGFLLSLVVVALFLWIGVAYFRRTERTFADLI